MATKGAQTRQAILDHALKVAAKVGLEGLSIGGLAQDLELSKSGLFAHFQSKEALQAQVLDRAVEHWIEAVIHPALKAPRGEPRIRALFEGWMAWARTEAAPGGCIFMAAGIEYDDRPGPIRDGLVRHQKDWMEFVEGAFRIAQDEGHFGPAPESGLTPDQFAQEIYGQMMGYYHFSRLMRDPRAEARARAAAEALIARARRGASRPL